MNHKNLFLTDEAFVSPRWQAAFPEADIQANISLPPAADTDTLVWILAASRNWLDLVSFYSQSGCKVIVLTRLENTDELRHSLEAGARGYTEALANIATLQQVALSVHQGAMWLPSALVTRMIGVLSEVLKKQQSNEVDLSILTEREKEVTQAVITGASNKEIARKLDITERTVKAHLSAIFQKLDVRDRMHLMLVVRGH
ncbi:response regulator transcription factor [Nitrincola sp.]|uniref:response regulator transcription factor n=1 Tax=Nitrincola sp. TaxID=1926584 RepID=UPI003A956A7F